jgi:pyruvate kinase
MKRLFIVTLGVVSAIIASGFTVADTLADEMPKMEMSEVLKKLADDTGARPKKISASRKTKVIATLGPASSSEKVIRRLVLAGVNVFRVNFSHGTHEGHKNVVSIIRKIENELGTKLTIMADLQGPKLRIGTFVNGEISLKSGDVFKLDLNEEAGDLKRVYIPHPEIIKSLVTGTELLLDDGRIRLQVVKNSGKEVETIVVVGGVLSDKKGLNIPNAVLPIAALTEKDKGDIKVINDMDVDWVAVSFVQTAEDMTRARELINKRMKLVAKIEKPAALKNIDSIIDKADAIMVARGDLGVELRFELVPVAQKMLVDKARCAGKPVIVATQMLESMVSSPVPTRAEASDVSNAVRQGADAVMLSAETASGAYPEEAVRAMTGILIQTEENDVIINPGDPIKTSATSEAVTKMVGVDGVKHIVIFSGTEQEVMNIASRRPGANIIALTDDVSVSRRLGLVWGTSSGVVDKATSLSQMEQIAQKALKGQNIKDGTSVAMVVGVPLKSSNKTSLLYVYKVGTNTFNKGE